MKEFLLELLISFISNCRLIKIAWLMNFIILRNFSYSYIILLFIFRFHGFNLEIEIVVKI